MDIFSLLAATDTATVLTGIPEVDAVLLKVLGVVGGIVLFLGGLKVGLMNATNAVRAIAEEARRLREGMGSIVEGVATAKNDVEDRLKKAGVKDSGALAETVQKAVEERIRAVSNGRGTEPVVKPIVQERKTALNLTVPQDLEAGS